MSLLVDWSNEAALSLVEQYRNQPVLWNTRHGYHYSKVRKQEAWERIAHNMGLGVDDVRQKINSLLGSFRRERSKMRRGEGKYGKGNFTSGWFAFNSMQFLLDRNAEISEDDDKIFLEELQVKQEEDEEEDLALDSDSSRLLEEELNEASTDTKSVAEKRPLRSPTQRRPPKRLKIKQYKIDTDDDFLVPSCQDECALYGQYVACKLRKLSDRARAFAERDINNVLFQADLGKFDSLPSPTQSQQQTGISELNQTGISELNGNSTLSSCFDSSKSVSSPPPLALLQTTDI